jgi:hypothetical protein
MYRPVDILVTKPNGSGGTTTLWDSGTYTYDPSGNITAIGSKQTFSYDLLSRLRVSNVIRQVEDPGQTTAYQVTNSYDIYGNMTQQAWQQGGSTNGPADFAFTHGYTGTNGVNANQIEDTDFDYDLNGNMRWISYATAGKLAATWGLTVTMRLSDGPHGAVRFFGGLPYACTVKI